MTNTMPLQAECMFDAQAVARLRKREPGAMADLYDRYGNIAYSVVIRIVGNHHMAEGLVQETFLRVWTRMSQYAPERGSLRAWILTIARNKAIDHLRSFSGRAQVSDAGSDRLERLPCDDKRSQPSFDDGFIPMRAALAKLTDDHRVVLELAYFQGMTQTEMAARLNQPLGTVKTWVRTALRVLRLELQPVPPTPVRIESK